MESASGQYAFVKKSSLSFDATLAIVRQALEEQGFGVLCEIDVSDTLKKKLDADHPRTLILGVCNPPLALRALTAVPDISVFLPCNVVIRMNGEQVEVAMINPMVMGEMMDHPEVKAVALEAAARLQTVLSAIASHG